MLEKKGKYGKRQCVFSRTDPGQIKVKNKHATGGAEGENSNERRKEGGGRLPFIVRWMSQKKNGKVDYRLP